MRTKNINFQINVEITTRSHTSLKRKRNYDFKWHDIFFRNESYLGDKGKMFKA